MGRELQQIAYLRHLQDFERFIQSRPRMQKNFVSFFYDRIPSSEEKNF